MLFIFDDDDVIGGASYTGRSQYAESKPSTTPMVAEGRNMWVNEEYRKRTKAEAKERLPHLPTSVRRQLRKKPIPSPIMIPFYALELADILIEIDPLDRLED